MSWSVPARADDPSAATGLLNAGIAAYRTGDYGLARDCFLQAQTQGDQSETLRFNLALSYYKLRDYALAQAAFESLRASASLAAAAEYHLGLVAAQSGHPEQARAHWRTTQAISDSIELRQLAELALRTLDAPPAISKWSALASAGGGVDSNRTQSSDTVRIADVDRRAAFAEVSAAARYRLDEAGDGELNGSVYRRDYEPDQVLDQTSAQLGLRGNARWSGWHLGAAVEAETAWLAADDFQNAAGLNLDAERSIGASSFGLRYRPSRIKGARDTAMWMATASAAS